MFGKRNNTLILKTFVVFVSIVMATAGFTAGVNSARIIPNGRVMILENGKVIGEFSKESPLPEGAILKCDAQCAVKMNDAYIVLEPDTVFSVSPMADSNHLLVQDGTAYFSITESSRPLQLETPNGVVMTREISMTGSEIKGYVRVVGDDTEIGIIDGGTITIETEFGQMAITPGNQITIASLDPDATPAVAEEEGISITGNDILLGAAGAGVILAGGLALSSSSSGSSSNGSPSSP